MLNYFAPQKYCRIKYAFCQNTTIIKEVRLIENPFFPCVSPSQLPYFKLNCKSSCFIKETYQRAFDMLNAIESQ